MTVNEHVQNCCILSVDARFLGVALSFWFRHTKHRDAIPIVTRNEHTAVHVSSLIRYRNCQYFKDADALCLWPLIAP